MTSHDRPFTHLFSHPFLLPVDMFITFPAKQGVQFIFAQTLTRNHHVPMHSRHILLVQELVSFMTCFFSRKIYPCAKLANFASLD